MAIFWADGYNDYPDCYSPPDTFRGIDVCGQEYREGWEQARKDKETLAANEKVKAGARQL